MVFFSINPFKPCDTPLGVRFLSTTSGVDSDLNPDNSYITPFYLFVYILKLGVFSKNNIFYRKTLLSVLMSRSLIEMGKNHVLIGKGRFENYTSVFVILRFAKVKSTS